MRKFIKRIVCTYANPRNLVIAVGLSSAQLIALIMVLNENHIEMNLS
jgi:hypothetical protein